MGRASLPLGGLLDRLDELAVTAAAADVPARPLPDLLGGTGVAFLDAADAGHDLAGGAVAALERVLVDERPLQRMQFVVIPRGQPLDGGDVGTLQAHRQCEARVDPLTVDQNRAGPAGPGIAALLGSGQTQVFA